MIVNKVKLAEFLGVDERTISNWMTEEIPCPSAKDGRSRVFRSEEVHQWLKEKIRRDTLAEKARATPADKDELQLRRLRAETELAEHELQKAKGTVIPVEIHEEVAAESAGRLRAVLLNLQSNYTLMLERVGVPAKEAQEVLEAIAADLTRSLRDAVEEMEVSGIAG